MKEPKPQNEITRIRYKQRRGETLTEQETELLAEYFAQYARRKKSVHLKEKREEEWTKLALEQGVPLSQCCKPSKPKAPFSFVAVVRTPFARIGRPAPATGVMAASTTMPRTTTVVASEGFHLCQHSLPAMS